MYSSWSMCRGYVLECSGRLSIACDFNSQHRLAHHLIPSPIPCPGRLNYSHLLQWMRHLIPSPVLDAQLNPIPCPSLILMGCNACLLGSRLDLDSTDIVYDQHTNLNQDKL